MLASAGYGVATLAPAQSPWLPLALTSGLLIGTFDALATTIRPAAVQPETPDAMRGRAAIYQMASRGGPALGDFNIGWVAGFLGPVAGFLGPVGALSLGGFVSIAYAGLHYLRGSRVSRYSVARVPAEQP
ncbi:hypothetical protein ACFLIM_35700 [Nonomuraea sp. M3C6]|uniref:MFS transporter n=1 Tax=Nonomuraea marmarensis TaxID=3351344 RepID=A0ABW7AME4_9ACTN